MVAFRDDIQGLRDQADRAPKEIRIFCGEIVDNLKTLASDAKSRAGVAARRLAVLIRVG